MSDRIRERTEKALGYRILACPGCGAWPVRSTWLRRCATCRVEMCRICLPEGFVQCESCERKSVKAP